MISLGVCSTLLGAYLIGSVASGFIIAQLCGVSDIRSHGSGNIGATNVARVLGKKFFALVLLIDAGKAFGYLAFLGFLGASQELLCLSALALLLGNSASIFLRFGGGKGVSTTVGLLMYLSPSLMIVALLVWGMTLVLFRTVGLASVLAASSVVLMALRILSNQNDPVAFTVLSMALWVIYLHRKNIKTF